MASPDEILRALRGLRGFSSGARRMLKLAADRDDLEPWRSVLLRAQYILLEGFGRRVRHLFIQKGVQRWMRLESLSQPEFTGVLGLRPCPRGAIVVGHMESGNAAAEILMILAPSKPLCFQVANPDAVLFGAEICGVSARVTLDTENPGQTIEMSPGISAKISLIG